MVMQVDWRDRRHWRCNNNVHPSRHGTYDAISMHPFETVFIKASWHVGEPFLDKYSAWMLAQVSVRAAIGTKEHMRAPCHLGSPSSCSVRLTHSPLSFG